MGAPTLSLVVPASEEECRLPTLLAILATSARQDVEAVGMRLLEAVIVDDGSVDDTGRLLAAGAAELEVVQAVRLPPPNRGKGAAVAAGIARARGDYVLLTDVDLATPLGELAKLSAAIERGVDVAIGSRALLSSDVQEMPRHRHLMGLVFNRLIRALTGLPFRDTQCGFKLLSTAHARQLTADQIVQGFAFDVELLVRARRAGLVTEEVPVAWTHDPDTRVRAATAPFKMTWDVLRVVARLR